jgi:hypothetical protein
MRQFAPEPETNSPEPDGNPPGEECCFCERKAVRLYGIQHWPSCGQPRCELLIRLADGGVS